MSLSANNRSFRKTTGCRTIIGNLSSDRNGWIEGGREATEHAWQKIPGYYNITWPPMHRQLQSMQRRWSREKKERERGRERTRVNGWRRAMSYCCSIRSFHYRDTERRQEPIRHVVRTPPWAEKPTPTEPNMEGETKEKPRERSITDKQLFNLLLIYINTVKMIGDRI